MVGIRRKKKRKEGSRRKARIVSARAMRAGVSRQVYGARTARGCQTGEPGAQTEFSGHTASNRIRASHSFPIRFPIPSRSLRSVVLGTRSEVSFASHASGPFARETLTLRRRRGAPRSRARSSGRFRRLQSWTSTMRKLLTWGYVTADSANRDGEPENRTELRKDVKFGPVFLQNGPEPGSRH